MGLRLRGESWYLRRNIGGKRVETPLGVYGITKSDQKRAATAAKRMAAQLKEANAATQAMRKFGLEVPSAPKPTAHDAMTFADWWTKYEATYLPGKAANTQRRDRETIRHWMPILGPMKMADIRQMHVLAGINQRRQATAANPHRKAPTIVTEATVQRERRFIQAMFERAIENDIIERNPFKGIKSVADKARNRLLTPEAEAALATAMRIPRKDAVGRMVQMDERWVRFVAFLLETGLRLDEVRSINPKRDIIKDHVRVTGKFRKVRDVPLTTAAMKILKDQIKADGELWTQNPQRLRKVLAMAAKRAKLTDPETREPMTLSPHDLRHTFGHRWLVKGGDIYTLSKILGHASVAVTERHYAKLLREDIHSKMMAVMQPGKPRKGRG